MSEWVNILYLPKRSSMGGSIKWTEDRMNNANRKSGVKKVRLLIEEHKQAIQEHPSILPPISKGEHIAAYSYSKSIVISGQSVLAFFS